MRTRLAQVLENEDRDEPMDTVVRRFWSRGPRVPSHLDFAVEPRVIELASWVRTRDARARR